jgi:hypothetical protein
MDPHLTAEMLMLAIEMFNTLLQANRTASLKAVDWWVGT